MLYFTIFSLGQKIIQMFFERNEDAIGEVDSKYRRYLKYISINILKDEYLADEVIDEVYLKAWNLIPPQKPDSLKAYLAKITRTLSINVIEQRRALKRGAGEYPGCLDEMDSVISDENISDIDESLDLRDIINSFLRSLGYEERCIFIRRYWYFNSVKEIAKGYSISESKVKISLMRTRKKLRKRLEKEGIKYE